MSRQNEVAAPAPAGADDELRLIVQLIEHGGDQGTVESARPKALHWWRTGTATEPSSLTLYRGDMAADAVTDGHPCPANDSEQIYFEIYRVNETQVSATRWVGGEWRWRLCAPDGATIASSSGYRTSAQCLEAAAILRRHAGAAKIYELA